MKIKSLFLSVCGLAMAFSAGAQTVVTDTLEYAKGVYNSPEYLIQGNVAGVRVTTTDGSPTTAINTNIRGLNSVRGTSEPLWIIDGVALTSSSGQIIPAFWQDNYKEYNYMTPLSQLDNLNLYDIESIQVLKNVSATAIYGAKGANGVIIINTKMPVNEKVRISWNSNVGLSAAAEKNPYLSTAISHNHNLAIGATVNSTKYRLSAFFRDVKSPVPGVRDIVGGLKAKFDTKTNQYIWFGMNASLSVSKQNSVTSTSWYGTPSMGIALRDLAIPAVLNTVEGWKADYDDYSLNFRTTDGFYLQVNFTPWLKWRTDVGVDYQTNTRYFWYGTQTQFGLAFNRASASSLVSLLNLDGKSRLEIDRYIAEKHHINVTAGAFYNRESNRFNTMNGSDYTTELLRSKGFSLAQSAKTPRWTYRTYFDFGFIGTLAYDFNGIVGLNGTVRGDRYDKYDADFTIYPAGNAFFDVRKAFFADSKAVSTLRIEGGWGKAGLRKSIPYALMPNYINNDFAQARITEQGYEIDETDETKEKSISNFFEGYNRILSTEYNVSLKAGFIEDRITLTGTFYNKETVDEFDFYCFGEKKKGDTYVWKPVDRKEVFTDQTKIGNKGVELELSVVPVKTKLVKWTVFGNAAYNINKVLELGAGDEAFSAVSVDGLCANRNSVGNPVSSIYGIRNYNRDGSANYGIIGNPTPKILGSVGTNLRVQRFTLDILANGASGFDVIDLNRLWLKNQSEVSEQYVRKGDYLRIARASIAYSIPVEKVKWIKSLSVNVTGTNLVTFTNFTGYNPEVNSFGGVSNACVGIDYGSLPLVRTFMLGVCANF